MKNKMICKKCGEEQNLLIAETKNNNINWKIKLILNIICIGLTIWTLINFLNDYSQWGGLCAVIIITAIINATIKTIEKHKRRKTHTKVICENCGNIWYLD